MTNTLVFLQYRSIPNKKGLFNDSPNRPTDLKVV